MSKKRPEPDAILHGITTYKGFNIRCLTLLKCRDNKPRDLFVVHSPNGECLGDGFRTMDECQAAITSEANRQ
jgi:hypothetical protein